MKYITIERYLTEFPLAEQYDNDLITQFINNAESDFDGLCGANVINDFLNALNQFQDRTDADVTLFETAICKQTDFLLDKEHREGITQMNISNNGVNNSIKLNGVLYDSSAVKILEQLQIYIKSTQVYRMGSEQKPTTVDNDYATKKWCNDSFFNKVLNPITQDSSNYLSMWEKKGNLLVGALYKEKDIIAGGTSYIPLMGERDEEYFVVAFAGDTINDLYGFYWNAQDTFTDMFIGEHEKGNITVYSNQVYDNAGRIAVITDSQTPTIDNIVYCSLSIPPRINTNKLITWDNLGNSVKMSWTDGTYLEVNCDNSTISYEDEVADQIMRFTITDIYAESSFAVPFQLPIPIDITQDRYVLYFKIDFIKINEQWNENPQLMIIDSDFNPVWISEYLTKSGEYAIPSYYKQYIIDGTHMLKVSNNDIYAPDMSNHIHFNLLSMIYYDNTQGALHVNISDEPNNAISKKDDGLFVDTPNVLFKGYYATLADLQTSYPTPPNPNDYAGFYAYVNSTTENALYNNYIWDIQDAEWTTNGSSGGAVNTVSGNIVDNTDATNPIVNQIQADWNQTTSTAIDYIKNKPTIPSDAYINNLIATYLTPVDITSSFTNLLGCEEFAIVRYGNQITASFYKQQIQVVASPTSIITVNDAKYYPQYVGNMYNCVFTSGTNQLVIARAISTTNYIQIWANTSGTVDIRGSITWYITPWND